MKEAGLPVFCPSCSFGHTCSGDWEATGPSVVLAAAGVKSVPVLHLFLLSRWFLLIVRC